MKDKITILTIDDKESTLQLVKEAFDQEEINLIEEKNITGGIETFIAQHDMIDVVVTDFVATSMNGLEISKAIRGVDNDVPIVMIASPNPPRIKRKMIDSGASCVIEMPLENTEMFNRIVVGVVEINKMNSRK